MDTPEKNKIAEEKPEETSPEKKSESFGKIVKKLCNRWFIQAFSGMAQGLFVTLIAGTIIKTLGGFFPNSWIGNFLIMLGGFASIATGCGIGIGIAHGLKSDKLVMFSAAVAGLLGAYAKELVAGKMLADIASGVLAKGLPGNPISAYVCSLLAVEIGGLVSGKTKLDILLVPLTCIFCAAVGLYVSVPFIWLVEQIGAGIKVATEATPFFMGIIIAVVMGMLLTLPTSSAAIWISIVASFETVPDSVYLAGGAAVVGCACHMVGFAVMSYKENGWGGLISQGLGTSMLQIPNVMRKPVLFIPPVIASAITGPLSTCLFKLRCNGAGGGMGTSGLVGVIGTIDASKGVIEPWVMWLGIILLMFVLPAIICYFTSEFMRKKGWIKDGDLKI